MMNKFTTEQFTDAVIKMILQTNQKFSGDPKLTKRDMVTVGYVFMAVNHLNSEAELLLLNHEPEASTETLPFSKHGDRRSAATSVETITVKEVGGEGSVQPGADRQNEQAKEVNDLPEDCQSKNDGICKLPLNSCKQCNH